MKPVNENKIQNQQINFSSTISEQYLKNFAHKVEEILKSMITGRHAPVSVSGEKEKVEAFAKALGNEERYIRALQDSSPTEPQTMELRHQLESAIAGFEKATGIKWPIR